MSHDVIPNDPVCLNEEVFGDVDVPSTGISKLRSEPLGESMCGIWSLSSLTGAEVNRKEIYQIINKYKIHF